MAIDLDWLVSRFDSVSEKYPGLVLVGLESPKEFTSRNCEVPDSEWGMHFPVRTYEGEYGHQFYYAGESVEHIPQGINLIKSLEPLLAFPKWTFGGVNSNVLKRGWWSIWLYRKFGFDPEFSDERQNLCSNSECLDAYQPILELATDVLIHQFYSDQEWYCEQGVIHDTKWRCCAPWLLFLLSHFRIRRESQNRHVIDDVGIASSIVLRSLRDSLLDQDTTKAPQQADNKVDDSNQTKTALPEAALKAVIDGGLASVMNQAIKVPAKQRHSETIMRMLKSDARYYEWSLDEWASHLGASKKTIQDTEGWRSIMQCRAKNKLDRFVE
jgi:hypothetical protein